MKIKALDSNGYATIYATNKARCIGDTIYFISETESSFPHNKKRVSPMYIKFPSKTEAQDAFNTLFDTDKLDLSNQELKARVIADDDKRMQMNYKARDEYFAKFGW